jgi:hypothetical protein
VQNPLSSRFLHKNKKINVYRNKVLLVGLYGCETWSLILREGHRLRLLLKRALREIFESKRDEVTRE